MNLEEYLSTDGVIPLDVLVKSMNSTNLNSIAQACYALTRAGDRLEGRPNPNDCRQFLASYYLRCIKENITPSDAFDECKTCVASRFEAANELRRLLEFCVDRSFRVEVKFIVQGISDVFIESDAEIRNVIETGFLEHLFERADLRYLFDHWRNEPVLSDAYHAAVSWGRDHARES